MYYTKTPRGMIKLNKEMKISEIMQIDEREFSFEIITENKSYQFSGETKDDTYMWHMMISKAIQ